MRLLLCSMLTAILVATGGCDRGKTRQTVVMAVVSNILVTTGGEAVGEPAALTDSATSRLTRIVEDLNADQNLQFVVFLGGLLGDGQARSLDPVKSALRELKKPYYIVLGPEGLPPAGTEASRTSLGSDFLAWTFQGHGFDRPQPYWSADVGRGLVLVALHSAAAGAGQPGHIDREQLHWLESTLTAHRDEAVAVFCYHALAATMPFDHTFLWQRHMVDNAPEVLEVLNRHGNVTLVASASHAVSFGTVVGSAVHLRVPAVSIWPLSYNLVRLSPKEIECQNVSTGTADETRRALDRLAADETSQKLFGAGERSLDQLIQTFGGRKSALWPVTVLRP